MIINEQKKIEYQGTTVWRYRLDNRTPIIADIICSSMAKQMDKRAEKQQRKFVFCIGDEVRGMAEPKCMMSAIMLTTIVLAD